MEILEDRSTGDSWDVWANVEDYPVVYQFQDDQNRRNTQFIGHVGGSKTMNENERLANALVIQLSRDFLSILNEIIDKVDDPKIANIIQTRLEESDLDVDEMASKLNDQLRS